MNIATALNRKYVNYTIVMLTSLCINNPVHIDAYLLHCELTDEDIDMMQKSLKDYNINLIPTKIDRNLFSEKFPVNKIWSIEMYFRLLLGDILPKDVERILYLDVDIIVNKDITNLYSLSFGSYALGAAYDRNGCGATLDQLLSDKQKNLFGKIADSKPFYFNSGVLLINIKWIRDNNISFDTYLQAMKDWNFEMAAPDQDILNYVFYGKVKYFDWKKYDLFTHLAYNHGVTEKDASEVSILHFTGHKPWNTNTIHYEIENIWWKYARETNIYYTLTEQYITQMTKDKFLEEYNFNLVRKMSYQRQILSEQKKAIDKLENVINMLKSEG